MYSDFAKILNCINSSNTVDQLQSCDNLCQLFRKKWIRNQLYVQFYDNLILKLNIKKQSYVE